MIREVHTPGDPWRGIGGNNLVVPLKLSSAQLLEEKRKL